ncbi:hypothetical protein KOW79_021308 [Hemibagrus wyckioides]|uniref:Micro-fibrillar-associated protein 1 C-terminal domain-containing protein n=1 Tax=Hemibagrus wyckioides TaxID=337641 RepID=A0A9D3N446_9TELE|nr:hypothetical protein KOW79_021308 [Hemibagrus wyckioides]
MSGREEEWMIRKDRVSVAEREAEDQRQKGLEIGAKKHAETLKIVEEEAKKKFEENKHTLAALEALDMAKENEEEEYKAWKVRELKRSRRTERIEKRKFCLCLLSKVKYFNAWFQVSTTCLRVISRIEKEKPT